MAYDKAEYYSLYRSAARDSKRRSFNRYTDRKLFGGKPMSLRLHYHPLAIKPLKARVATQFIEHFDGRGRPLTAHDVVFDVGGAFGWLGEALQDMVPGLVCVTIDTADYIHENKTLSADDEIIASLEGYGTPYDDGERGTYLFELFSNPAPRSRSPEMIVRTLEEAVLIGGTPTVVVSDDAWMVLSAEERKAYTSYATECGAAMAHRIDCEVVS